jgi:IQ and AAA domain-containing protein
MPEVPVQEKERLAAQVVQCRIRGILARKDVERQRQEEMVFLGMQRKPKTDKELENDNPIQEMNDTNEHRKQLQEDHMIVFDFAKQELEDDIEAIEGVDIMENMLNERRVWIQEQKAQTNGKVPQDIAKFYERNNLEQPLNAEDEEAKKAAEDDKGKKKGAKDKGKKDKKKKGKDDGDDKQVAMIGPSEIVLKFDQFYKDYNVDWSNRDETKNPDQAYDRDMAVIAVRPEVEKKKTEIVDAMIKQELANMMVLAKQKGKKKKKSKKKSKKKKKKKLPKLPGLKFIATRDPYDLLVELIQHNIVKKLPPTNLKEFIGEFNYIHSMLDDIKQQLYDPSMALIRQLVTEYIIFPLGSSLVRNRIPEHVRSFLFYGPTGTGKTQIVRAIAHETKSIVFDLSPSTIDGQYATSKATTETMVAMVFVCAKEYQPSLIYIDEAEKIWPAKKKKKKGQKKPKKNDMTNPNRIEKALSKWRTKWITDETRITIVACTSEPHEGNKKKFKKFFDKTIYFPFPDYTTRRLMWKTFITELGGKLKTDFPLSTLAHISAGYSAGSIKRTCENVLTEFRRGKVSRNLNFVTLFECRWSKDPSH